MNFFKYKNELIFGLAIAFALKAVATADWLSAGLAVTFFVAHHVERFLSAQSVETQVRAKVAEVETSVNKRTDDIEAALRIAIEKISHVQIAQGLTNRIHGANNNIADGFFGGGGPKVG